MNDTRERILRFIVDFMERRGYAPSMGEIQRGLAISAGSVVEYHLKVLEREGRITRDKKITRSIRVSGLAERPRRVPLLGTIAAGRPIDVPTDQSWYADPEDMVEVPDQYIPPAIQAFALKVKGNSMIDALVGHGDIVVLEAVNTAENGQMVAAWLSDREEATLKKLYQEPDGRIRLQPANPVMKPIYVDPEQLVVQGRVIAVMRKLW